MADLFPNGFIWTPLCPDLDQAIGEPRYESNLPSGVPFWTPLGKFAWQGRQGRQKGRAQQFRAQVHSPKTMADLFPNGLIRAPLRPDLDQAIREPRYESNLSNGGQSWPPLAKYLSSGLGFLGPWTSTRAGKSLDKTSASCVSLTPEGSFWTIRWSFSDALEFDFV